MTPKELAGVCDDILAAYVKGDLRDRISPRGPVPKVNGQRRRRPALISLEVGEGGDTTPSTPDPVVDGGRVDLGLDESGEFNRVLIDFCGLEDYVVREEAEGVTLIFLWVSDYPVVAPSPGLDIPAVDFSDDVGSLGLPAGTTRVVSPSSSFEPGRVVEECMFAVQAALGEQFQDHAVESRIVTCRFEDVLVTRQAAVDGLIV